LVSDRHQIGGLTLLVQVETALVDDPVALEVILVDPEFFNDVEHRAGVQQHRAEDRALSLGVVRQPVGQGRGTGDDVSRVRAHGSDILP